MKRFASLYDSTSVPFCIDKTVQIMIPLFGRPLNIPCRSRDQCCSSLLARKKDPALSDRRWPAEDGQNKPSAEGIRPFCALISILETLKGLSRNSFGIVAIFPTPFQPGFCPDWLVSPVIIVGQEIVSGK